MLLLRKSLFKADLTLQDLNLKKKFYYVSELLILKSASELGAISVKIASIIDRLISARKMIRVVIKFPSVRRLDNKTRNFIFEFKNVFIKFGEFISLGPVVI